MNEQKLNKPVAFHNSISNISTQPANNSVTRSPETHRKTLSHARDSSSKTNNPVFSQPDGFFPLAEDVDQSFYCAPYLPPRGAHGDATLRNPRQLPGQHWYSEGSPRPYPFPGLEDAAKEDKHPLGTWSDQDVSTPVSHAPADRTPVAPTLHYRVCRPFGPNAETHPPPPTFDARPQRRVLSHLKRDVKRYFGGSQSALLVFHVLGLLLSSCGNSIYFKKMTSAMPTYGWYLSQITCLAYVPLFGAIVFWSIIRGHVTPAMRRFPTTRFALMGALDAISSLMFIMGGAFTDGPTQQVLGQAVIPIAMLISRIWLHERFLKLETGKVMTNCRVDKHSGIRVKEVMFNNTFSKLDSSVILFFLSMSFASTLYSTMASSIFLCVMEYRYHVLQYIGAIVIVLGVVVTKLPQLLRGSRNPVSPVMAVTQNIPLFNLIFVGATLPGAVSQIYKEVAFRKHDLDVNYMQYWVAVFQIFVGAALVPLDALPFLGPERIHFGEIEPMILDGTRCLFFGENNVTKSCGVPNSPPCSHCEVAWVAVSLYLLFNVAANIFTLLIVKHGGAALSFIVVTMRLPLITMCFYSHTIMGDDATRPTLADCTGLAVLLVGLVAYRCGGNLCALDRTEIKEEDVLLEASSGALGFFDPNGGGGLYTSPSSRKDTGVDMMESLSMMMLPQARPPDWQSPAGTVAYIHP